MLPLKNNPLRQPYPPPNDDDDEDDEDEDDDQRIDGSTMRYPVERTAHPNHSHNPTSFAPQHQHQQLKYQQPPLGLTGVLCDSHSLVIPNRGSLHYTIYRPRSCQYSTIPPVVCVPGGPVLASNYLQSIVYTVTDRSVILYDPIGCGQSVSSVGAATFDTSTSTSTSTSVIQEQVSDLKYLLDHLPLTQFHLLGHSFGGILVYEYLKLVAAAEHEHSMQEQEQDVQEEISAPIDGPLDSPATMNSTTTKSASSASASASPKKKKKKKCCSVTLASTPVSIATCQADCDRLLEDIGKELVLEQQNHNHNNDHEQQLDLQQLHPVYHYSKQAQHIFWQRHECRVTPMPYALEQAFQQSSVQSTAGHGLIRLQQHPTQDANHNNDNDNDNNTHHTNNGLRDYVATALTVTRNNAGNDGSASAIHSMPPALVLRGQYDFVLASNSLDIWGDLLLSGNDIGIGNADTGNAGCDSRHTETEYITLAGTSHYAMVEQEDLFGSVLQVFFQKHDPVGLESQVPAFLRPGGIGPQQQQHASHHKHKHHQYKQKHPYLNGRL